MSDIEVFPHPVGWMSSQEIESYPLTINADVPQAYALNSTTALISINSSFGTSSVRINHAAGSFLISGKTELLKMKDAIDYALGMDQE